MKFTLQQLSDFALGVDHVESVASRLRFHRFPANFAQIYRANAAQYQRAICTSGVRLRFITDSRSIRATLRFGEPVRWYFTCVLIMDGERCDAFGPVSRQNQWKGVLFSQDQKQNHVFEIWLPHLCPAEIETIEVDDDCIVEPASTPALKWLAFGDSITQGMNASLPIFSWTARAARALNADLINYGVGGATLRSEIATNLPDGNPNLITISYGANDWNMDVPLADFRTNADALVASLQRRFEKASIMMTSPVPFFRATGPNKSGATLDDFRRTVEEVAAAHNIRCIRGTDLVPADHGYFNDWSHPNDQGHKSIADNLVQALK